MTSVRTARWLCSQYYEEILAQAVVERFRVHDLTFEAPWSHGKDEAKCERWIQLKAKMVTAKMRPDITQPELNAIKTASVAVDTTPEILDAIASKGKRVLCYLVGGPGAKNTYRRSAGAPLPPARHITFRRLSHWHWAILAKAVIRFLLAR